MPRYPRKNAKKAPRKRYARRKAATTRKTVSPSLKKYIKRTIHRNMENKFLTTYAANQGLTIGGSAQVPYFISLPPCPTQSVNVQGRVGNEITVVKSQIRGYVNILPYNATTNPLLSPFYVKMWVCSRKKTNQLITGQPVIADFNNFFQAGATSLGFQSNILDTLFYNNKDYWNIYATKTLRLEFQSSIAGTNAVLSPSGYTTQHFSFNLEKHLGRLKFNDSSVQPVNKELYLVFQTVSADGTSTTLGPTCEMHYVMEHQYEDA